MTVAVDLYGDVRAMRERKAITGEHRGSDSTVCRAADEAHARVARAFNDGSGVIGTRVDDHNDHRDETGDLRQDAGDLRRHAIRGNHDGHR